MDFGATSHTTPHAHMFHEINRPEISQMMMTCAKKMLQISRIRMTDTGKLVVLTKVLLVLKLVASLVSFSWKQRAWKEEGELCVSMTTDTPTWTLPWRRICIRQAWYSLTPVRRHSNTPTMFRKHRVIHPSLGTSDLDTWAKTTWSTWCDTS